MDAVARLTKASMRPMRASCFFIDGFLLQECVPNAAPEIERIFERCSICFRERSYEIEKLDPCFQFRIQREVADDDLFLVEVAHLNGDVRKKPRYSHETTVAHDGRK